jgi:hypothetical protein
MARSQRSRKGMGSWEIQTRSTTFVALASGTRRV